MLQAGCDLDLAVEALRAERGSELGEQDLEGDGSLVLQVLGQEYRGHPPASELALERVLTRQPSLKLRL
jgi:hypothetical protein